MQNKKIINQKFQIKNLKNNKMMKQKLIYKNFKTKNYKVKKFQKIHLTQTKKTKYILKTFLE